MTYQIYDHVLPKEEFQKLKSILTGPGFPWFYASTKSQDSVDLIPNRHDFQFVHLFYKDGFPTSEHLPLLKPIIKVLDPSAIVRIKANLTTATSQIFSFGYHRDIIFEGKPLFQGETAIFYLNSNDGYTEFEDGTRVESVENRLLIFDARTLHAGTSCTNEKFRCLINFNYYTPYS